MILQLRPVSHRSWWQRAGYLSFTDLFQLWLFGVSALEFEDKGKGFLLRIDS